MSSTMSIFVFFLLSLVITTTEASRYGLVRVGGSLRHEAKVPSASTASNRALANEDFQMADSMAPLSMEQLSMARLSMADFSMSRLSMADLSMAPMSMVGLSMASLGDPETDNSATQGHNNKDNNGATIQGPGDDETIQVNDGMRNGVSAGLVAAGFLMLVVASASIYKIKRYAALSQNIGDELSVPTAV